MDNSELFRFADSMAFYESSNNNKEIFIDNQGRVFIGLFQFSYSSLQDINLGHVFLPFICNKDVFPIWMQYVSFAKLCVLNERKLAKFSKCYNKNVHGVFLTKSGVLAACHLAGYSGFVKWLKTGKYDKKDINNTKITDYVKKFSNFKL